LLGSCTSTPGGLGPGMWSGDVFLQTLGSEGPGIDPAAAYFDYLCGRGEYDWCENSLDDFRGSVMLRCFEAFQAGFTFPVFEPGPAIAEQLGEVREAFLANNCAGECNNKLEVYEIPHKVAPTAGGDAVREMLGGYVLSGAPTLVRYDDGFYTDAPFEIAYSSLRATFGVDQGWIAIGFVDHGEFEECQDLQNRALLAVHHENHLVIKLVQSRCLVQ
jgi:hypothetical protein